MNKKIIVVISALIIPLSMFAGLTMAAPRIKMKPLVLLGSYKGQASPSGWTKIIQIQSSKPALYTVSVYENPVASILLSFQMPSGYWKNVTYISPLEVNTVAAHGARIYANEDVFYYIIVEGEEDTVLTVG